MITLKPVGLFWQFKTYNNNNNKIYGNFVEIRLLGRSLFDHVAERVRAGHRHIVRGVRRGGGCVLGVRRGPVRQRHRNDDRTQTRSVLEIVLVLHKSCVLVGEFECPLALARSVKFVKLHWVQVIVWLNESTPLYHPHNRIIRRYGYGEKLNGSRDRLLVNRTVFNRTKSTIAHCRQSFGAMMTKFRKSGRFTFHRNKNLDIRRDNGWRKIRIGFFGNRQPRATLKTRSGIITGWCLKRYYCDNGLCMP